jgi:hypothetical protein
MVQRWQAAKGTGSIPIAARLRAVSQLFSEFI